MIVPKGSVPKIPITMGESGWEKAADGHSTNFAKLKMKPALIRYSEESDASRACAKALGAQLSETLSATIRIPSRLNIKFPACWWPSILRLTRNQLKMSQKHFQKRCALQRPVRC